MRQCHLRTSNFRGHKIKSSQLHQSEFEILTILRNLIYNLNSLPTMIKILTLILVCHTHVVQCFETPRGLRAIAAVTPTTFVGGMSSSSSTNLRKNHRININAVNINSKSDDTRTRLNPAFTCTSLRRTFLQASEVSHYHKREQITSLKLKFMRLWQLLHRWITKARRYSIYVLECEHNKYYVGSTSNIKRRMKEHQSPRGGSKWTRLHKPLRVVREYKRIPEDYYLGKEAQVTAELMLVHGINNVRGAMFAESRDYTIEDLPALKGFLGHYNELSYKQLNFKLQAVLKGAPSKPSKKTKIKENDKCHNCGKMGHWANECPQNWKSIHKGSIKCYRCGKAGHHAKHCCKNELCV